MRGPVGRHGGLIDVGDEVRDTMGRLWNVTAVDRDTATLSRPGSGSVVINRRTGQKVEP